MAGPGNLDPDEAPTIGQTGVRVAPAGAGVALEDTPVQRALAARYEVERELGRGGMGVVYKARDRETGDVVALKVLRSDVAADPRLIERFKSELLLARKITHKNVCRTHELLRFGEVVVISMEYVEGQTLRAFLTRFGGVPLRRGLEWAQTLCSALAEAHAQGVVHRDLKPENLLITSDGGLKVMDFGIARSLEGASTGTGALIGTPAYMSPEQATGKRADARSDIYSLGLILYEMFVGRPAFRADTPVALALMQIHETPRPAQQIEPYLPAFLGRVIERCLEKSPERRFQSVADLGAALSDQPAPLPTSETAADEISPTLQLTLWRRRDSALLGLGVLGLVVFLALFAGNSPYGDARFTFSAEEAAVKAARLVSPLDPQMVVTSVRPFLVGGEHWWLLTPALLREDGLGWAVELERPGPRGPHERSRKGGVALRRDGTFSSFGLEEALPSREGPPREKEEELRRAAVQYASDFLGVDVSQSAPEAVRIGNRLHFQWKTPGPAPNTEQLQRVSFTREGLSGVWQGVSRTKSVTAPDTEWVKLMERGAATVIWRGFTLAGLSALLLLLFLKRRLYRGRAPGVIAMAAALLAAVASATLLGRSAEALLDRGPLVRDGLPEGTLGLTTPPGLLALGVLFFLWAYVLIRTSDDQLARALPARLATWRLLWRDRFLSTPAALALLRGLALGAVCLGLHALVLRLATAFGWAYPSLVWLSILDGSGNMDRMGAAYLLARCASTVYGPGLAILSAGIGAWGLVAFPAALSARVTRHASASVLVPATLCCLMTATLPGASVVPLPATLLFAALQGAAFGFIFFRWDFLTMLVALFTAATWVLAYPIFSLFREVAPLKAASGLLPWWLLVVFAVVVGFRPQLAAAWRRVAAVFE